MVMRYTSFFINTFSEVQQGLLQKWTLFEVKSFQKILFIFILSPKYSEISIAHKKYDGDRKTSKHFPKKSRIYIHYL